MTTPSSEFSDGVMAAVVALGFDSKHPRVASIIAELLGGQSAGTVKPKPKSKPASDAFKQGAAAWNVFCKTNRARTREEVNREHPDWTKSDQASTTTKRLSIMYKEHKAAAQQVPAAADSSSDEVEESNMQAYVDSDAILGDKGGEYAVDDGGKIWNMDGIHVGNMDDGTVTAV